MLAIRLTTTSPLELDHSLLPRVHPAWYTSAAPTALDNFSPQPGDDVYFFGNSGIRDGDWVIPSPAGSEATSACKGMFYEYAYGGWNFDWAFGPQPASKATREALGRTATPPSP